MVGCSKKISKHTHTHTHDSASPLCSSEIGWCLHPHPVTHWPSYVRSISALSSHSALMTAHECIPSSSALSPTAATVTTPFLVSSSTCLMLHAQLFTPLRRSEKQGARALKCSGSRGCRKPAIELCLCWCTQGPFGWKVHATQSTDKISPTLLEKHVCF